MDQYILDNTDDEFSHANFLLSYLESKGANTADLDSRDGLFGPHFRTLQGSMPTGSTKKLRLTNITQLQYGEQAMAFGFRSDGGAALLGPETVILLDAQ
jgi:hypothetical protein